MVPHGLVRHAQARLLAGLLAVVAVRSYDQHMNSLMQPSDPESRNTYWLRRGIVALAALVSVALVWWVLSGLFGNNKSDISAVPQNPASLASVGVTPSPSATPSASPSPSASSTPSASASPSSSASASESPTPTPNPTPTGPVHCTTEVLSVTVEGDKRPTAGASTAFQVQVANGDSMACVLDLDESPLVLEVTSGPDRIWTTAHCAKWAPRGTQTIRPGEPWKTSVTWQGKRSKDGCGLREEALRPGTYRAAATLDGVSSRALVMNLQA
ncbi:hypothetical protein GCM10027030_24420 [Luteococcus sediminum]